MSTEQFPIFGRQDDLEYLRQRIKQPGLTALAGRPQIGKTRLLEEIRDEIRDPQNLQLDYLVGYFESSGAEPDSLLRALEQLYSHWLSQADYLQQARKLWTDNKDGVVKLLGIGAAEILSSLMKPVDVTGLIGTTVKTLFSSLVNADEQLKSGGIQLPRLSYEQAKDVLTVVHKLSGKPAVLILDAFEQSPDVRKEAINFHRYLSRINEWPPCHFIVTVRFPGQGDDQSEAYKEVEQFAKESAKAEARHIKPMNLEQLEEQNNLLQWMKEEVPGSKSINSEFLIQQLDGFPGTLRRWKDSTGIHTEEEFSQQANAAKAYRYAEVDEILEELRDANRELLDLAIRLVMLPEFTNSEQWQPFFGIILGEDHNRYKLTELERRGLLEVDYFPSFGLTARYEYTQEYVATKLWNYAKPLVEKLIIDLASEIDDLSERVLNFASALLMLSFNLGDSDDENSIIELDPKFIGLLNAAESLYEFPAHPSQIIAAVQLLDNHPRILPLIALGTVNALQHAQNTEQKILIDELRFMSESINDFPDVQIWFAQGLFNAFNMTIDLNYFDELEKHYFQNCDNVMIREIYGKGLYNALLDSDASNKSIYLSKFRKMNKQYPGDTELLSLYANGLLRTINKTMSFTFDWLDELHELTQKYSDNSELREVYGKALFKAIHYSNEEEKNICSEKLLQLVDSHPEDKILEKIADHNNLDSDKNNMREPR
ncbi:MAG: hypothetical protein COA78_03220 [Blastopirellula sp.]|nr:MAG: hypothetical protein COA78_03220 [Blastopirellula sp.]